MNVEDRMTKSPLTISPRDTAEHAIRLMDAARVDSLPVCEGRRLVGLITRADLLERVAKLVGRHPSREQIESFVPFVQVAGLMILEPPRVEPESPVADAVHTMRASGLTALPVVEDRDVVGIITARDLRCSLGEGEPSLGASR